MSSSEESGTADIDAQTDVSSVTDDPNVPRERKLRPPDCSDIDKSHLCDMILYLIFLVIFSLVVYFVRDPRLTFPMNNYMKDLFLFEEFPDIAIYKKFEDVATVDEFWQYLEGVWLPGLLADQGAGPRVIYGMNYLIGAARLRQVRVRDDACTVVDQFDIPCQGKYSLGDESEDTYGSDNQFTFQTGEELGNFPYYQARVSFYAGSGFVQDFGSASLENETARMQQLQEDGWVDLYTRAIFADWAVYNANVNLFCVAQLTFEFLPSGGVVPDYKFRILRAHYNPGTGGTAQAALEIFLVIMVLGFASIEVYQVCKDKARHTAYQEKIQKGGSDDDVPEYTPYFTDGWNYLDWFNIIIFMIAFVFELVKRDEYQKLDIDITNTEKYYNLQNVQFLDTSLFFLLAINAFCMWFKVFKFTSFSPKMTMIQKVMKNAFIPLLSFVVMFFFILLGFAQAGVLAFGSDVDGYGTYNDALLTVLLATSGDLEIEGIKHSNRVFGVIYFFLYIIIVFFIILSMFVAIVDRSYEETEKEIANRKKNTLFDRTLAYAYETHYGKKVAEQLAVTKTLEQIKKSVSKADKNKDGVIDMKELEEIINQTNGYFEMDVEQLMAKYDVDQDEQLDDAEKKALFEDIRQQQSLAEKVVQLREHPESEFTSLLELLTARVNRVESHLDRKLDAILKLVDTDGEYEDKFLTSEQKRFKEIQALQKAAKISRPTKGKAKKKGPSAQDDV